VNIGINASSLVELKSGLSFYIVNIIEALARIDRANKYVVFCKKSEAATFASLPDNFQVVATAPEKKAVRLLWEQTTLPFILCKRHAIEVLFSPNYTSPVFKPGFASVVTFHDSSFFDYGYLFTPQRRVFKHIIRLSLLCSDRAIAVSECTKRDIVGKLGGEEKIRVVYNAAHTRFNDASPPPELVRTIREKYNLDRRYILFTGLLEPRKNIPRLIEAYAMISNKIAEDLVIAGGGGWWQDPVFKTVESLGIRGRVKLLGYVPNIDMPVLYKEAIIFAFPTLYEGFGIAALEAMACGTPVLAADNSSLPEVVGKAGIYVDPFDVKDIAEKLQRVLTTPALLAELKSNCGSQAAGFSWEKSAQETLAILTEGI
jgi:glycosyltransferase involved in cell wall biosynthesis